MAAEVVVTGITLKEGKVETNECRLCSGYISKEWRTVSNVLVPLT